MSLILYHAMCHMSCVMPCVPLAHIILLSFCPVIFLSYCLSVLFSICPIVFLICCLSVVVGFWVTYLSQHTHVSCHVSYVMLCALLAHIILLFFCPVFFLSYVMKCALLAHIVLLSFWSVVFLSYCLSVLLSFYPVVFQICYLSVILLLIFLTL